LLELLHQALLIGQPSLFDDLSPIRDKTRSATREQGTGDGGRQTRVPLDPLLQAEHQSGSPGRDGEPVDEVS
jgi:hypothetical protein